MAERPLGTAQLVSLRSVVKSFGSWTVLDDLDLEIAAGSRLGIVGANGSGKSTLMRVLSGLEDVQSGDVTRRRGLKVAYLPQFVSGDERNPVTTVLAARPDVAALDRDLRSCEQQLAEEDVASDLARMERVLRRQEQLLATWVEAGGPGLEGQVRALLVDLGLEESDLTSPTTELSGGQRKLVALAACLITDPWVLLLDEPESHLDAARRQALEVTVAGFEGAVVIVSHDRYLLDETVSQIGSLEDGQITLWPGNYSAYAVARELQVKRQQVLYVTQQKEIARLEEAVRRFRHWASIVIDERHIRQARNKQRQIDRMDKIERPVLERKKLALDLRSGVRGGQKIVELSDALMAFDGEPVLVDVNAIVMRGERVGIVGPNGAGKTVLGRMLAGTLTPTQGDRWQGPSIEVGYLSQSHDTQSTDETPIQLVRRTKPMYEDEAVKLLTGFLFRYDQARQPVAELSGGERTRLALLQLMLSGANCLLLDEPTNHLDIDSMEVLESALERYDGTVIVISHDRYFLDRMADRIIEVKDGSIASFEGGFSDYNEARAAV